MQDEPFQAWDIHQCQIHHPGIDDECALETRTEKADVVVLGSAPDEREGLEHRTGGEHVVEVPVLHFGVEDVKLLEVREEARAVGEVGRVRKGPETKAEVAELGAAEDVRGEAQAQLSR